MVAFFLELSQKHFFSFSRTLSSKMGYKVILVLTSIAPAIAETVHGALVYSRHGDRQ
jgi:hypothetical protein